MNVTFNDDYGDSDLVVLNNTCRKNYQDIFAIYQSTKLQLTAKIAELNNTIFKLKQSKHRCEVCEIESTSARQQTSTTTSTPKQSSKTSTEQIHKATKIFVPETLAYDELDDQYEVFGGDERATTVIPETCLPDWSESDDAGTQQKGQQNAENTDDRPVHMENTGKPKRKQLSMSRKLAFNKQKWPEGKPPGNTYLRVSTKAANTSVLATPTTTPKSTAANEDEAFSPFSPSMLSGQPITTQDKKKSTNAQENANDSDDTDKENIALSQVFVSRSAKALTRNIVDNKASESASTDKKISSLFDLSSDSESDAFKETKIAKSPAKKNVKKSAAAGPKLVNYRTPSKTKQLRQTRIDVTRLVPPVTSTKLHKLESFEGGILKSGDGSAAQLDEDTRKAISESLNSSVQVSNMMESNSQNEELVKKKKDRKRKSLSKKDKKRDKRKRMSENGSPKKKRKDKERNDEEGTSKNRDELMTPKSVEEESLDDSFDRVPRKQPVVTIAHVGGAVRKQAERRKLNAYACRDCEKWFDSLGLTLEEREKRMKNCKHRAKYQTPSTPEHFWNIGFPDTQECYERGYIRKGEAQDAIVKK